VLDEPESGQPDLACRRQENVARCDVAMDETGSVYPINSSAHIGHNRCGYGSVENACHRDTGQRRAVDVVEHQVGIADCQYTNSEHGDHRDVVGDIGHHDEVLPEPRGGCVVEHNLVQHLHRDITATGVMMGAVHHAAAAAIDDLRG